MPPTAHWMIYGANGYTGRLIAEEAHRRGLRPMLAGRSVEKIEPLARRLDFPYRAFSLDDPSEIAAALDGMAAVLHCAGPFAETAEAMITGCLAAGAHYLDITGEIDVIEHAASRHAEAQAAGVCLIPAVGFDVVPTDCLAAMLAEALPGAAMLQLGIFGLGEVSPGTAKTVLEHAVGMARVRRGGIIQSPTDVPSSREIPFADGPRTAQLVAWGDVASAYHSTGIPNITVYMALPPESQRWQQRLAWLKPLIRLGPFKRVARRWIEKNIPGPNEAQRAASRASMWGEVRNDASRTASATLQTPGGYPLTVLTALLCIERLLASAPSPGFSTPSKAFGSRAILDVPGVTFRWEDNPSEPRP